MKSSKKKGLGRGLSALFGDQKNDTQSEIINTTQKTASIGDLNRNRFQPRINFDKMKISELAASIKKNGLIQPIAVREDENDHERYEIVAGERRWLAAQEAGLHEVPIVVLNLNNNEALEVAIVENIQREDLNVIEEARGYLRLKEEFGYDQDKISQFMSKSRSHISNTIRLLSLPKDIIAMLDEGLITAGQARPLVGLSNASQIAEEIISRRLSSRMVEDLTRKTKNIKKNIQDPNILIEAKQLEEILGLKVSIVNKKNNSGKIFVEYKNLDQYELIVNLLKKN
tara:strand:+ start:952 stop:1806 length:855 start_codon:yes stop_codon:yes gene_type:complete